MSAGSKVSRPRVLHIGKYFPPMHGGMEAFLSDLVRQQRDCGLDARVLVHGDPCQDDPAWVTRVPVQAELVYAPIAFGFRRALARLLRDFRPQVLHLHMPNNAVFWALTLDSARHVPWVVHWHSDVVASRIRPLLAAAYRLYRPFERAVLDQAGAIVATSPPYLASSEPLQAWREKCSVVPLGMATAGMPADEGEASRTGDAVAATHWTPQRTRLLCIGRLAYYKGFETLIEAVCAMDGVELLIAGDGELNGELNRLIARLTAVGRPPAVRLLGKVSEGHKQALLASCDVFCMPSRERTEAFGMVLLEAMASGAPCLVSDLPGSGMPWVVEQAGAGRRVPLENVGAWREALRDVMREPQAWRAMGRAGRRQLQQRFSIAQCERGLRQVYAQVSLDFRPQPHLQRTLVVMPARNEAATVAQIVEELVRSGRYDVLVVDDHSTDGTGALAAQAGARVLRPVLPLGAWGGMQAGIRYALAQGYAAVITMDADGQHGVQQLPSLTARSAGADMVIGAFPERASRARRIAWHWFRWISRLGLTDLTSGFRHYNRRAMAVLASPEATLLDYQDVGTLLLLRRRGLHIVEVPVSMQSRVSGKSRIFSSWFKVGRYMAVTTVLCLSRWGLGVSDPAE